MKSRLYVYLLLCLHLCNLHGQTADDNIVITQCTDSYVFTVEKDGTPCVRNRKETAYEATRMGASLQPHIYYGEFITLDGASAKGGGKAEYKSVTPENVFFDDSKVCFFNIHLDRKGKKTETDFKRTFHDLRYLTQVYLGEEYFIKEKQLTFIIPQALSHFRLTERNFTPAIRCTRSTNAAGDSVFTYTVTDMPAMKREERMPASGKVYPHLLITGSFEDYRAMYRWSNGLAQVDCRVPGLEKLLAEITEGCRTDREKIGSTYAWVQQHIRYIAFEAGIQGHKPDTPAEVLRKRYGDCKGMALLLRTLLKAQGFDARLTDIGTADVPYPMSQVPTLAAANHMICTLFHQGNTYYLDATNEYIPPEFVPGSIQGREAVIEDGEACILQTLPTPGSSASTDSLHYACTLSGKQAEWALQGKATRCWSGDMKELFLTAYHQSDKDSKLGLFPRMLAGNNLNFQADSIQWIAQEPRQAWAILSGTVLNKSAVQHIDAELYIAPDPHCDCDLFDQPIDTAKRVHDYELPFRCRIVRHTEVEIPAGYALAHCPEGISLRTPQGTLSCSFQHQGSKVVFRKVMEITERRIPRDGIAAWNASLRKWTDVCHELIILKKQ